MLKIINKKFEINAFVLIELLITISIFAIVIAVVYSTFYIGIKAYRRTQEQLLMYQEADQVLDRLSQELRNCYDAEYNEDDQESGFIGGSNILSFSSIIDSYVQGQLSEVLVRITYSFSDGKIFKKILKDSEVFSDSEESKEEELLSDIKQLSLEYLYFEDDNQDSFIWLKEWDDKAKIPKGIKIAVTKTNTKSNHDVEFQRFIYIEQGNVTEQVL